MPSHGVEGLVTHDEAGRFVHTEVIVAWGAGNLQPTELEDCRIHPVFRSRTDRDLDVSELCSGQVCRTQLSRKCRTHQIAREGLEQLVTAPALNLVVQSVDPWRVHGGVEPAPLTEATSDLGRQDMEDSCGGTPQRTSGVKWLPTRSSIRVAQFKSDLTFLIRQRPGRRVDHRWEVLQR